MRKRFSEWGQIAILSLISLLAVVPLLTKRGLDIVTLTYLDAAARIGTGADPYAAPRAGRDWFKYSPAFAWLYQPFLLCPPKVHAVLWAALNIVVFWWGVSKWFRIERRWSWLEWLALVAAAMEMDISLRYQQVNALIVGLLLIGLAAYRDGRLSKAGALLGVAADLKILPAVFAGALLWPPRRKYGMGLFGALVVLCVLPVLSQGVGPTWRLHEHWLQLLAHDLGERGLLDLRTVLQRLEWPVLAESARMAVMIGSVVIFGGYRLLAKSSHSAKFDWGMWYAFGVAALLLLSPRTESPTFVLMAPAYLFCARRESRSGGALKGLLVALMIAVTIAYTDLWPKALWNPKNSHYASKTLGVLGLWVWSGILLIKQVSVKLRSPQ